MEEETKIEEMVEIPAEEVSEPTNEEVVSEVVAE